MSDFTQHLDTIAEAKHQTDEAVKSLSPTNPKAMQVLAITWEVTFDLITRNRPDLAIPDLGVIAGICYKLAQSQHQFMTVDHKSAEFAELQRQRRRAVEAVLAGLPPSLRDRLERELNLLC